MKKWIASVLLCCVFAVLLNGCANKPGTSLEAPPSTAAGDPTGTGTAEATNPATNPTATSETQPAEGQPTESEPSQVPKPTEGQPKPTETPTVAQPQPTEAPKPKPTEGHKHSYQAQTVAATCTEKGYTLHTCSCGDSYTDSYTNATGHSYDSGKVTTPATCDSEGVKTYTCTKCGATKAEAIAKTAHSYTDTVVAPTYSAGGYTQHTCSVCGYSYTDSETEQLVFDINYWVEYAKDLAREMGFTVEEVPVGTGSEVSGGWGGWDNPIDARPHSADNGILERRINQCLSGYKREGIKNIWVWAEPCDDRGGYNLYVAYA